MARKTRKARPTNDALAEAVADAIGYTGIGKCRFCGAELVAFTDPRHRSRYGTMAFECADGCEAHHEMQMAHVRNGIRF
jgi:hypothetical protein